MRVFSVLSSVPMAVALWPRTWMRLAANLMNPEPAANNTDMSTLGHVSCDVEVSEIKSGNARLILACISAAACSVSVTRMYRLYIRGERFIAQHGLLYTF